MMEIMLGAISGTLTVLVFIIGVTFGYSFSGAAKVGGEMKKLAEVTTEEITKQRQQMKAENDAFNTLMGYDVNTAYGIGADLKSMASEDE